MAIEIPTDLILRYKGGGQTNFMVEEFGTCLYFAGHLILVLQYLYTSIIMPKILLQIEIKLEVLARYDT